MLAAASAKMDASTALLCRLKKFNDSEQKTFRWIFVVNTYKSYNHSTKSRD